MAKTLSSREVCIGLLKKMDVHASSKISEARAVKRLERAAEAQSLPDGLTEDEEMLLDSLGIGIGSHPEEKGKAEEDAKRDPEYTETEPDEKKAPAKKKTAKKAKKKVVKKPAKKAPAKKKVDKKPVVKRVSNTYRVREIIVDNPAYTPAEIRAILEKEGRDNVGEITITAISSHGRVFLKILTEKKMLRRRK